MYYVFEGQNNNASYVKDAGFLNEKDKERAIELESLPIPDKINGKIAILKARKSTNEVWYDYEDIRPNEEVEELKERMADLFELVLFGGDEIESS